MESSSSDEKDKLNRILRKLNFIASVLSSIRRCIQKYAQLKLKFKIRKPIDHANAGMIKYPIEKNVGKKKKKQMEAITLFSHGFICSCTNMSPYLCRYMQVFCLKHSQKKSLILC